MNGLLVFIVLLLLPLTAVMVARALTTGRWGFGRAAVARSDDPAEFWFRMVNMVVLVLLALGLLLWSEPPGAHSALIALLLIPRSAFWLVQLLRTGRAAVGTVEFQRGEEPREYWLVFAGAAAILAFLAWLLASSILMELSRP